MARLWIWEMGIGKRWLRVGLALSLIWIGCCAALVGAAAFGQVRPLPGQIAFQSNRDRGWRIYVVDIEHPLIARLPRAGLYDSSPAWSPNGSQVAFTSYVDGRADVFVVDLRDHSLRRVTDDYLPDSLPTWLDDRHLTVVVEGFAEPGLAPAALHRIDSVTGERERLGVYRSGTFTPVPAPDGRHAVSVARTQSGLNLHLISIDDPAGRAIAVHDSAEKAPAWSSDSRQIAFGSRQDGNWEIYVVSREDAALRRITYDARDDLAPAWRPLPVSGG